ncbi:MAG TPA: DNA polymerase Y family protein [Brevundimonas sp.]|uniref:DNA polymerase Y family protein n=1 Tax=Brevundimonas sp. TaxID=1871086 RepID=UPI002DE2F564|nr:DNA polymerase Y family protein [Brevundimonas sp.]
MNDASSSNRRRYLAVWFPWLPSDRLARATATCATSPEAARPVVVVDKVGGALRLVAVDPQAAGLGLSPGMTLADAQARTPDLKAAPHEAEQDDALLSAALNDFDRFTPMISLDPPHGVVLDVTGCAHLFGGEAGLVAAVHARAGRAGLQVRMALAGTPECARALCRFGPGGSFDPGADRAAARRLPVAALELSEREEQALRRAGLKRIGDLDDRPRAPLAARFGRDFPARLARVLGDEDVRITPHRPPPPFVVDRIFFEPVSAPEDVERVLADLIADTARGLEARGQGGRAFQAGFYRVDGAVRRVTVRTGRPTREAATVLRLFRERLANLAAPVDPGFGFDQIRMTVTAAEALAPVQSGLQPDRPTDGELARLVDRLTARLGPERVLRFHPHASHMPERAQRLVPAAEGAADDWSAADPEDPPLRPLQMFHPPQPVDTLAEAPDGHPYRFRWRRVEHRVARAEGPERIAGEWWRAPDQKTRDYYRVEDVDGRRFWLFRQGQYGEADPPRWFVHGLFA